MQVSRTGRCLLVCMVLATLSVATDALAIDYFVRKTGSNANAGTSPAAAWLTVDYAADNVAPGDTVYVGAGTYTELVFPAVDGTLAQPIQLIADTDGAQTGDAGEVILVGPTGVSSTLYISNTDYIHIYGFKITGSDTQNIYWYNSDGGVLDNCEITASGYYGMYIKQSELNVRGCNIHSNPGFGIYASGSTSKNTLLDITDCTISNNNKAGVYPTTQYVTANLSRCKIQNNTESGLQIVGATVTATNCLITGTTASFGVYGYSAANVTLRNCTVADNGQSGVRSNSSGTTLLVTNCLIANNTYYGLHSSGGSTMPHTYNLVYGNPSGNFNGTSQDATEIVADPQFIGSGYQITLTSPAANAGTDMTGTVDDDLDKRPRPYDGAWDIGCYEEGPVGHWKLDETSGTTASDSSGLGNDGTYTGTYTLGQQCAPYLNAAYLGTAAAYVDVNGSSTLDPLTSFTAACWIKSDTENWNDGGYMVTKVDKFSLFRSSGSKWINIQVTTDLGNSSETFDLSTITDFDIRNWHHYAASYDSVEGVIRLYVDGVSVTSKSITSSPLASSSQTLQVGSQGSAPRTTVDDVRVYNRRLTDLEIAKLYGMVGHWKLDETSGAAAIDATVFGNDGTYTNGPLLNQPGEVDRAVDFDGANDYVGVTDNSVLQMNNTFSLAAWIQADASTNTDRMIINKEGEYEVALSSSGEIKWGITNADPGWSWHYTGYTVTNNIWIHVAVTYNNGVVSTYANGELVDTYNGSGAVGDQYTSLNELRIGGCSNNPTGKYFDGSIDDARVYNRALCPTEIKLLYNSSIYPGVRIIQWVEVR